MNKWDEIVRNLAMGVPNKHWDAVLQVLTTADDSEYMKLYHVYADLLDAIDRYNLAHKGLVETKFVRKR